MVDLSQILSKRAADIKPPNRLCQGTWLFRVVGWGSSDTNKELYRPSKAGIAQLAFEVQAEAPVEVEPHLLETVTLPIKARQSFWPTEENLHYVKDFVYNALGMDSSVTLAEALPEVVGKYFKGDVLLEIQKDASGQAVVDNDGNPKMFPRIKRCYPAT